VTFSAWFKGQSTFAHYCQVEKDDFQDGEAIVGSVLDYDFKRQGFFVVPVDPGSNNSRIFLVGEATTNTEAGGSGTQWCNCEKSYNHVKASLTECIGSGQGTLTLQESTLTLNWSHSTL